MVRLLPQLPLVFFIAFSWQPTILGAQENKLFIGESKTGFVLPEGPTRLTISKERLSAPTESRPKIVRPKFPPLPKGRRRPLPPGPFTPAPSSSKTSPKAALSVFKNAQVPPGRSKTSIAEPAASHNGHTVLFMGNWYAALSKNDGSTWSYLSPYQFPRLDRGFCCDQYTMYVPSNGMTIWLLQYLYDLKTQNGSYRIAIAKNETDLKKGIFHSYVFNPRHFGLPAGYAMDFPHMAYSNGYLYVTTNIFFKASTYHSTVCWRMPLSQLASGKAVRFNYIRLVGRSWRFTFGATKTMYWWQHKTNSSGYLFQWADSSTSYQRFSIKIGSWNWGAWGGMVAKDPKGHNWMANSDSRTLGAWIGRGIIGFMWPVKQGGSFPYPYTRVIEIRESNKSLFRQSNIWNPRFAWAFPAASSNSRGHVGGVISFGGGPFYPSSAAWVVDDLDTSFVPLKSVPLAVGTDSFKNQGWGHFFTSIPHSRFGNTWVGTAMSVRGLILTPRYVHFGRSRDVIIQPDLRPISLGVKTSTLRHGSSYVITTKIENVGITPAGTSTNGIYISTNKLISTKDLLLRGFNLPPIPVGSSGSFAGSVLIPSTAPTGTCWLGVYADRTHSLIEVDESNNTMTKQVTCEGMADLSVTTLSTTATQLPAGGSVQVSFTVKNIGKATAPPSITGILLSTHSRISNQDTYLGGVSETTLGPGASRSHTTSVRIPYATPSSTRYLGVFADVEDSFSEISEGNNGRSLPALASIAYTGRQKILEYRDFSYGNFPKKSGAYSRTKAILASTKGGKAPMYLVAPKFKSYGYLLLLSGNSSFKFDTFSSLGLSALNSSILPLWLGTIPSGGMAIPSFNLPKTTISNPFTMYVHSFWFDSTFKNIQGMGNNHLYLRIEG